MASTEKLEKLEQALRVALNERDELARDVEHLCLQGGAQTGYRGAQAQAQKMLSDQLKEARTKLLNTKLELEQVAEELSQVRSF